VSFGEAFLCEAPVEGVVVLMEDERLEGSWESWFSEGLEVISTHFADLVGKMT
jgi:hypothetical protein